jgi:hypothetical protein
MSRSRIVAVVLLFVLALSIFTAEAAISIVGSFGRGSIIFSGVARGLGNVNELKNGGHTVRVYMQAVAVVSAQCRNAGGNTAPGRNPILLPMLAGPKELIPDSNGSAPIFIEISPSTVLSTPISPTPKQAGCPNGNWTVTGIVPGSERWQSASIYVTRDGVEVLRQNYSCLDTGTSLTCTPS